MSDLARQYLARARSLVEHSRVSLAGRDWALSVTHSGEATEYALKAALLAVGVTYRREHDVSRDLVRPEVFRAFPTWFQEKIPRFGLYSSIFFAVRVYARYGEEAVRTPPSFLFKAEEAEQYLRYADEVCAATAQLLGQPTSP